MALRVAWGRLSWPFGKRKKVEVPPIGWIVRILTGGSTPIMSESTSNEDRTKKILTADSSELVSVFRVTSDYEEVTVAAAHHITRCKSGPMKPQRLLLVNFSRSSVISHGLDLEPLKGETGIPAVDREHFNLKGSIDGMKSVVAEVAEDFFNGSSCFRTAHAVQILRRIESFVDEEVWGANEETKSQCVEILRHCNRRA